MISEKRIAILGGTGAQGFGLALRFAKAGSRVVIGSRDPERANQAVARAKGKLGAHVEIRGARNSEAVKECNVIFLTVPFEAVVGTLRDVRTSFKKGDILVDVTNPLASSIGGKPTKTICVWEGSAAQFVRHIVPEYVPVVAAFKNVTAEALKELESQVDCDVIVCGDDDESKREVMRLAEKVTGVRAFDGGGLENSRVVEDLTALLIGFNIRYKVLKAGLRVTGVPP